MRLSKSIVPVVLVAVMWARCSCGGGFAAADAAADGTTSSSTMTSAAAATTTTTTTTIVSIESAFHGHGPTRPSWFRDSFRHRRHLQEEEGTGAFCVPEGAALHGCTNRTFLTVEEDETCGRCIIAATDLVSPDFDFSNSTCRTWAEQVCIMVSACPCVSPCAELFAAYQGCAWVDMMQYDYGGTYECNITGCPSGSGSAGGGGGGGTSDNSTSYGGTSNNGTSNNGTSDNGTSDNGTSDGDTSDGGMPIGFAHRCVSFLALFVGWAWLVSGLAFIV